MTIPAERLADELSQVLEKQASLRDQYIQILNLYAQDAANAMVVDRGGVNARWLRRQFSKWLR